MHITAQQFMLALVSACDAFMLGGLNQNSLSAVSVIFFIATLFVPETLMRLFTNDIILIDYGVKYLKLIGLSYVFSGTLQVLQGILKNCGYVGECTMISTIVVCLNIVLNAVLIYGYFGFPRMTIAGAALATVIANEIGLVITIYILHLKKELWVGISDIKKRKINITKNLLICVCTGFGYGGSIIVGNLLGEGNLSEARKSGNTLCKVAVFSGILTGDI